MNGRILLSIAAVAAYTGLAAFFFAFWPAMGFGMRLVFSLGAGMLLHMLAMMAWGSSVMPRAAGTCILLGGALLQTAGWFVLLSRLFPQMALTGSAALLVLLAMAAQEALVYRHYRVNAVMSLMIAFLYGFALALLRLLGGQEQVVVLTLGVSMLLVAHGLGKTRLSSITPHWYVLGCCLFYAALFKLTRGGLGEVAYIAAAIGGHVAAIRLRSTALLFSAAFFSIAYLGYITTAYIMHGPLWSLSLVMLGVMAFGCLAVAVRLKRRYLSAI